MNVQSLFQPFYKPLDQLQSGITFLSPGYQVAVHRHYCYQVAISLSGPFDSVINGKHIRQVKGLIVDQQIPHSCQTLTKKVLVQFVEPESEWGAGIKKLLDNKSFVIFEEIFPHLEPKEICPEDYTNVEIQDIKSKIEIFIQTCFYIHNYTKEDDERINRMIEFANEYVEEHPTIENLAAAIYLSPERARHLFTEKVGMPFTQYMLWKRIRAVIAAVQKGASISDASKKFGFTDLAHFTRIFRKMFGVPPGKILRNCTFIL